MTQLLLNIQDESKTIKLLEFLKKVQLLKNLTKVFLRKTHRKTES
jgi:hypothetical protein